MDFTTISYNAKESQPLTHATTDNVMLKKHEELKKKVLKWNTYVKVKS
jgi:hypothetical protein